jgi:NAD(P)H:quinone oxidoreductase type IV
MAIVQIVFYSMYGHVWQLAQAEAEGASGVPGTEVRLHQVAELIPDEVLERVGAKAAREQFAHIPLASVDLLASADAVIIGTPTRFGNMCAQVRNFLDQTGQLWMEGKLTGKLGSAFVATGTQHYGQETTLMSIYYNYFHHGMIVVGIPPSVQELGNMKEITGGGPYGAGTMSDKDGSRQSTENELTIARYQGRHLAELAKKLFG